MEQYERFQQSPYFSMMYEDKMTLEVVLRQGNDIFVRAGDGIDYRFGEDIYDPFIAGENIYEHKNN
jgi:hypothetical protein